MIFITEESDLPNSDETIVYYFYASWMPFHKKMMTMISKIEDKYKNITFYAIDTDHFKSLCIRFNVKEIPTVIIRKENKELNRVVGLVLTSAFKSVFADIFK